MAAATVSADKETQREIIKQTGGLVNKWPTLTVAIGSLLILGYTIYEHFRFIGALTCG